MLEALSDFKIENIIDFLEKDRFTPFTAFVYLIILGVIRSVSESLYFEYPMFSMYLVAQHIAFNLPVLVLGVLVIQKATETSMKKVFNVVLLGFWITALPPFIDKFLFGLSGYEYSAMYSYYAGYEGALFIEKLAMIVPTHLLAAEHISPGLRFMIFSIVVFSVFYIIVKLDLHKLKVIKSKLNRRMIIKKIAAVFFGFFGIWLVVWFITASVPSVISFEGDRIIILDFIRTNMSPEYYFFFSEYGYSIEAGSEVFPGTGSNTIGLAHGTVIQQRSLLITMYFTILTAFSFLGTLYRANKQMLKKILKTVNTPLVYLTTLLALLGNGVLFQLDGGFSKGWAIDPTYPLHIPYIFYILIIGFFLGCFAIFIDRVFNPDKVDDTDRLSIYHNKKLAIVSFLAVASFSFLMGPFNTFPIAMVFMATIFLISIISEDISGLPKVLRFSMIGIFSFFLGFYTPGIWKSVIWTVRDNVPDPETFTTIDLTRNPSITGFIIGVVVVMFITLVILGYVSQILEKDKFPLDYPVSYALLPVFFLPSLVFYDLTLFVIFAVLGSVSITFMDDDPDVVLKILIVQIVCILLWLWGMIPSI